MESFTHCITLENTLYPNALFELYMKDLRLGYQALLKEIYSGWFLRFISLLSLLHQPKTRHIYIFISETNGRQVRKI